MISGIENFIKTSDVSIAIGVFDVLHLGHQKIIQSLLSECEKTGADPTLLTFSPHPRSVIFPESQENKRVYSLDLLEKKLKNLGVKEVIVHPFTQDFSKLDPELFWSDYIKKHIDPKSIFIGSEFKFGHKQKGDVSFLKSVSQNCDIHGVSLESFEGQTISTTQIKKWILEGQVEKLRQVLGSYYMIQGDVVKGQGIGSKSLFPTINLQIIEGWHPRLGVYAGFLEGQKTVVNIGLAPSVKKLEHPIIECSILDFDESSPFAKKDLKLELASRIRDEKKFDNLESLKTQIAADIKAAKSLLS